MISVIIPTYNEAETIEATIQHLQQSALYDLEILVVDGGSQDKTVAIVSQSGIKVIQSGPGRAAQMNAGAAIVQGEILLFLHADTWVPKGFDEMINQVLDGTDRPVAGAFDLKIAGKNWQLRLVEWGVWVRSRLFQLPYGDQGIFLRAETFRSVGKFPDLLIMEDFIFVRNLCKLRKHCNHGRIAIAPAQVLTNPRRWDKKGVWQTTLINQVMIVGFYLGVKPERLRQWYRSR